MEPVFLSLSEVLEIHQDQIVKYGGSTGIRDIGLLKSAASTPTATFGGEFLHNDICAMAAAYLFHIVKNHPFVDGNKRTGTVAALIFLLMNGHEFNFTEDELVEAVLAVASGEWSKAELTVFMRKHVAHSG